MNSPFAGFWFLVLIDLAVIFFLIYWQITDGFDPMRDGLTIVLFGLLNGVVLATRKWK